MPNYSISMLSLGVRNPLTVPASGSRNAGFIRQPRRQAPLTALLLGILLILSAKADPLDCWTRSFQNRSLYRIGFSDGLWVVVGQDVIFTSTDAINWTNHFSPTSEETSVFVALARGNGVFATVGAHYAAASLTGFGSVATSSNGLAWNWHSSGVASEFYGLAFGQDKFVAVGETILNFTTGDSRAAIFTSADGFTWTPQNIDLPGWLSEVTFANGLFVAVGLNAIVTSANGVDWSIQYYGEFLGVTYGAGIFVAVGPSGRVVTSTDGTHWTNRDSGQSFDLTSVAYGAGRFVAAVGEYGHVLSSTNAIDWRVHSGPFHVRELAYGGGAFVGVNENAEILRSGSLVGAPPPTISLQPQDEVVYAGLSVSLSTSQVGCDLPTFQWFKDGSAIGSNSPVLNIPAASLSDSGNYSAVLLNASGSVTSRVARVDVIPAPLQFTLQGSWPGSRGSNASASALAVRVAGSYAYVANGRSGLQILNVSNPKAPVAVGNYDTGGFAECVEVAGHLAYVADLDTGLHVIDVSNPASPFEVGSNGTLEFSENPNSFRVAGHFAYIADGFLQILDMSDPAHPVRVASALTYATALGVNVIDDRAYVVGLWEDDCDYYGFLQIFDISQPTNAVSLRFKTSSQERLAVAVAGQYAYTVGEGAALTVINISDPTNPVEVASYSSAGWAQTVQVAGRYVFLAGPGTGLLAMDVSNPSLPIPVAQYPLGVDESDGWDLQIVGNHAYLARGPDGLLIFEIGAPPIRSITRSGDKISLRWDAAPGRRLQRTSSLAHAAWNDVPDSEGRNSMELPIGSGEFFRLVNP